MRERQRRTCESARGKGGLRKVRKPSGYARWKWGRSQLKHTHYKRRTPQTDRLCTRGWREAHRTTRQSNNQERGKGAERSRSGGPTNLHRANNKKTDASMCQAVSHASYDVHSSKSPKWSVRKNKKKAMRQCARNTLFFFFKTHRYLRLFLS